MISGANRGLGNAVAKRLLADGYNLSAGGRDVDAVRLSLPDSDRVMAHSYDANAPGSDQAWFDATIGRFGSVDILINNAGVIDNAPFDDLTEDGLDSMWSVNVKAPFRLTQIAMPTLRAAENGRVVNVASLSGLRVAGTFAPGYAMSKHAVIALTEATKQAGWADGVRATAICPGYIATDMAAEVDLDSSTMIQPDDLAEMISTVVALPNTASVAQLTVACLIEPHF